MKPESDVQEMEPEARPYIFLGAALTTRRLRLSLTKRDLARRARIPEGALSDIEAGRRPPTQEELGRLARKLGTTAERLRAEGELAETVEHAPNTESLYMAQSTLRWAQRLRTLTIEATQERMLPPAQPCAREAGAERRLAEESWRRLEALSPSAREAAIGGDPILGRSHFLRWGLAERLCLECETTVSTNSQAALELAELALRVAERVAGDPAWRRHLQGYAWAFIAKARLAGGDRPGAEQAIDQARELWHPGCLEEPDFLTWPEGVEI